MAIGDTTTQEFDWTSYGTTETRNNLQCMDFISDVANNSFTDSGGSGENSNAYNNWRAINRVLAPQLEHFGCAVTGTIVRDSSGESWLAPGNNGNFQTDGLYRPPPPNHSDWGKPGHNNNHLNYLDWHYTGNQNFRSEMNDNTCVTTTYHSKDPDGVPVGQFVPLMMWYGNSEQMFKYSKPFRNGSDVYSFSDLTSIDDEYDQQSAKSWNYYSTYHNRSHVHLTSFPTIASCKFENSIWANKYLGRADLDGQPWNDGTTDVNHTTPGWAINNHSWNRHWKGSRMLWYAHDGEGNGMLVVTFDSHGYYVSDSIYGQDLTKYGHWNSHFFSTWGSTPKSAYTTGGGNSGQMLWKFPTLYTSLDEYGTKDILYKMAEQSAAAGTRWLVDPMDPSRNLMHKYDSRGCSNDFFKNGSSNNMYNMITSYSTTHHDKVLYTPHILMFPTKMGTPNQAALKEPVNFYFWTGYSTEHKNWEGPAKGLPARIGHQDIKFGEMIRTNCSIDSQPFYDGDPTWYSDSYYVSSSGHYAAWTGARMHGFRQGKMPIFMASNIGNVGINRITYGHQEPGPDMRYNSQDGGWLLGKEPRYIQFAGLSTSYNAITASEYSVDAGTLINNNNAWTNPEYLMDESRESGAVCTATGFENHLAVKLSGNPEGAEVNDEELIRQLIINIGGVRKLVLGPQILKVAIYEDDSGALGQLIAGPVVITADGNDRDIPTRQVVFEDTNMAQVPTYEKIQKAWCAFWVESPS